MTFGKMTKNETRIPEKEKIIQIPKFPQACANSDALNKIKIKQSTKYVRSDRYVRSKNNNNFRANDPSPSSKKPRK